MNRRHHLSYFTSSFAVVLGLVLVWRGVWYVLDFIDQLLGGSHVLTAVGGIVLGLLILYLPDKNLNELRKL